MTASSHVSLTIEQAAAAIMAMINASPRSPRQAEIEAIVGRAVIPPVTVLSDAQANLLEAIHECLAAEKALDETGRNCEPLVDDEAAIARYEAAIERMDEFADRLPPSRSLPDLVLLAQVACLHTDDRDVQGWIASLSVEEDGAAIVAAAKLVAAVLEFAGIDLR